MTDALAAYTDHRDLLFTIAYQMLGSAADAEDVLQETWIRWAGVDHRRVRDQRSYLASAVARLSLNRLRTLKRQRETYVGQWLPEPIATREIGDDAELAEAVSFAMLVVLETLSPAERVVFVMREVFGFGHDEIAEVLEKSPQAVRKIASRARAHVRERRERTPVTSAEHVEASDRFFRAVAEGDLQQLIDALAPGVVLLSDGGGIRSAVVRPIVGVEKVIRFIRGVRPPEELLHFERQVVNGAPSQIIYVEGLLDTVVTTQVQHGRVAGIYICRNPLKLQRLASVVPLRR